MRTQAVRTVRWACGRAVGMALVGTLASAASGQVPGEPVSVMGTAGPAATAPKGPEAPLSRELNVVVGEVPAVELAAVNVAALLAEDQQRVNEEKVLRYGLGRDLEVPLAAGRWDEVAGGGRLWSVDVVAKGALGVRLHLRDLKLPAGARLVAYSPRNPARLAGPLEGRGLFEDGAIWLRSLEGERTRVEVYFPGLRAGELPAEKPFTIDRLQHLYRDPIAGVVAGGPADGPGCYNDVTCFPAWANTARAVAGIGFIGTNALYCSGQMLNAQNGDLTPYYLTANHCLSSQASAQSSEIYWFFQTSVCNGAPPSLFSVPQSNVCDLLSTNSSSDFSLLMIRGALPGGNFWAGWNSGGIGDGTAVSCIHHPGGTYKRFSAGTKASNLTCGNSNHIRSNWFSSPTEPGSSGSGLFLDSNQQLIGQLHCGPSGCGQPAANQHDDYGAFSVTYASVSGLLTGGSDDGLEEDDSCAGARALGAGSYSNLVVKSTDADWYRVTVPAGGTITANLGFTHAYGDVDERLWDGCGGTNVATSQSTGNAESITYTDASELPHDYFLNVYLFSSTRNIYNLGIGVTPPPVPGNDICSAAVSISNGTYTGTTYGSVADGSTTCGTSNASGDVWYSYFAPCSGTLVLDTCGSTYDTVISVHSGCPGTSANSLGCNDDAVAGPCNGALQSYLSVPVTGGATYLVRVSGYSGKQGNFVLHSNFAPGAPNDACAAATAIGNGSFAFSTCGATTNGPVEGGCGFCCGDTQLNDDIWYRYTAACTGTVTIDLCNADYDSKVAVYGSACPASPGTAIACNDDGCNVTRSRTTFSASAGSQYLVRVGGFTTARGSGTMMVSCAASGCYANCDGSTQAPILNVSDFTCFLQKYSAADPYANCDGSTQAPILNVSDFTCFLQKYSAGCP